jgi:Peptidase family M23
MSFGRTVALGCCLIVSQSSSHSESLQLGRVAKVQADSELSAAMSSDTLKTGTLEIAAKPTRPFIEKHKNQQFVNFDLLVKNAGHTAYALVSIKLSVFDGQGKLEIKREMNENGRPPALNVIGEHLLRPGAVIDIFQPFYSFDSDIDLNRMHFDLLFMREGHPALPAAFTADEIVSVDAHPRSYNPASFCLPLQGLLVVHDGHDFYSHHRRYNLADRFMANPANAVSANLYAYDFMKTTISGQLYLGDPTEKEHWLSYGASIFAPAPGWVIEVVSDLSENFFDATGEARSPQDAELRDPNGFGNHVKIRHADGRVSWLLHMQHGSIAVKVGDHVHGGQFIGKIGFSGDSLFPHLHYNVTDTSNYPSQGVPSYFRDYARIIGHKQFRALRGQIDTGDLIRAEGPCAVR